MRLGPVSQYQDTCAGQRCVPSLQASGGRRNSVLQVGLELTMQPRSLAEIPAPAQIGERVTAEGLATEAGNEPSRLSPLPEPGVRPWHTFYTLAVPHDT